MFSLSSVGVGPAAGRRPGDRRQGDEGDHRQGGERGQTGRWSLVAGRWPLAAADVDRGAIAGFLKGYKLAGDNSNYLAEKSIEQQSAKVDTFINYESWLPTLNNGGKLPEKLVLVYPKVGVSPSAITVHSNGKFAYVADADSNSNSNSNSLSTYAIDPTCGAWTVIGSPAVAGGQPSVMAIKATAWLTARQLPAARRPCPCAPR